MSPAVFQWGLAMVLGLCLSPAPGLAAGEPPAPVLRMQAGHHGGISGLAFTAHDRLALSASHDGTLRLWDIASGKEVEMLRPSSSEAKPIAVLAASRDGRYAITGGSPAWAIQWLLADRIDGSIDVGLGEAKAAAFSPDGRLVAVGGASLVRLTTLGSDQGQVLQEKKDWLLAESLAFSPDSTLLAIGQGGIHKGAVVLWDIAGQRVSRKLKGKQSAITTLAFSPDGRRLLAGGRFDPELDLWDISSGTLLRTFALPEGTISSVAFTPDGRAGLATQVNGGPVSRWDLATGERTELISQPRLGNIVLSSDGRTAMSSEANTSIFWHWDVTTGHTLRRFVSREQGVQAVALSDDGTLLVTGLTNGRVVLWDIPLARPRWTTTPLWGTGYEAGLALTPDGGRTLVFNEDRGLVLLDNTTGGHLASITNPNQIHAAALTADGKRALIGGGERGEGRAFLLLSDLVSGQTLRRYEVPADQTIRAVALSAQGDQLLARAGDMLRCFDLETGRVRGQYPGRWMGAVSFSGDGKQALATREGTLLAIDLATGREQTVGTISGNMSATTPDGRLAIVTRSQMGELALADLRAAKVARPLKGHEDRVLSVAITADGAWAASGSADGTARLWNLQTGRWTAFAGTGASWLAFDSAGYWDASTQGGELVAMVHARQAWNIDQFAVRNNRPDLLLEGLPGVRPEVIEAFRAQHLRRLRKVGTSAGRLAAAHRPPVATLATVKEQGKFRELTFSCVAGDEALARYQIYANDVPLLGPDGAAVSGRSLTRQERVELVSGLNKIEVACRDAAGIESLRVPYSTRYVSTQAPELYYLAFGVSAYADPAITQLAYAAKDARDLGAAFEAMEGSAFRKVHTRILVDREVTREAMRAAKSFVASARADDTFVLFIAGHGVQLMPPATRGAANARVEAPLPTYYFVTADARLADLAKTAVPFERVEELLHGILPRQKLLLMDTCESGEDQGDPAARAPTAGRQGLRARTIKANQLRGLRIVPTKLARAWSARDRYIFNDVARRSGAITFSSSRGDEASLESDEWQQGAFTSRVLRALADARADTDRDASVSVRELCEFVSREVAQLTNDLQHPTVDRDNLAANFGFPLAQGSAPVPLTEETQQRCTARWSGAYRGPGQCWLKTFSGSANRVAIELEISHASVYFMGVLSLAGPQPRPGTFTADSPDWPDFSKDFIQIADRRILERLADEEQTLSLTAVGPARPCDSGSAKQCWIVHGTLRLKTRLKQQGEVTVELDF